VLFGLARSQLWEIFLVMAVAGLGVGAAFAAFPALIVSAVPASETGSAMSLNQVLRYTGFAVGSALTATVLTASTPEGGPAPAAGGYTTIAVLGLAVCLATALVTWLAGPGGRSRGGRAGVRRSSAPAAEAGSAR
jgi:MFS family permease